MKRPRAPLIVVLSLVLLLGAGVGAAHDRAPVAGSGGAAQASGAMTFDARPLLAAQTLGWGLYEPAIAAGADGTLYVSAHADGAVATRAPTWVSRDDGASWSPTASMLPAKSSGVSLVDTLTSISGGSGDEGIVTVDPEGHAWQFDEGGETASLYEWCDAGATLCRFVPQVFDHAANAASCQPSTPPLDRPWQAAANGKVLLVNDGRSSAASTSAMQIALYDTASQSVTWNMCAAIGKWPGVPAMRGSDGEFVVPQVHGHALRLVHGKGVQSLHVVENAAPVYEGAGEGFLACGWPDFGFTAVDADGTFYALVASGASQLTLVSTRDFASFGRATIETTDPVNHMWVAANPTGSGALVAWATEPGCAGVDDYRVAHAHESLGALTVTDVTTVATGSPNPDGDYFGAALLPDGRAAIVTFSVPSKVGPSFYAPGTAPITVFVQTGGTHV